MKTFNLLLLASITLIPLAQAEVSDPCTEADDKIACITNAIEAKKTAIESRLVELAQPGPAGVTGPMGPTGLKGPQGDTGANGKIRTQDQYQNRRAELQTKFEALVSFRDDYVINPLDWRLDQSIRKRINNIRRRLSDINRNTSIIEDYTDPYWGTFNQTLDFPKDNSDEYLTEFTYARNNDNALDIYIDTPSNVIRDRQNNDADYTTTVQLGCTGRGNQAVPYYCSQSNPDVSYAALAKMNSFTAWVLDHPPIEDNPESVIIPVPAPKPEIVVGGLNYGLDYTLGEDTTDPLFKLAAEAAINTIIDNDSDIADGIDDAVDALLVEANKLEDVGERNDALRAIIEVEEQKDAMLAFASNDLANNLKTIADMSDLPSMRSLLALQLTDIYLQYRNNEITVSDAQEKAFIRFEDQLSRYMLLFKRAWRNEAVKQYEDFWSNYVGFSAAQLLSLPQTPDFVEESLFTLEEKALANEGDTLREAYANIKETGMPAANPIPMIVNAAVTGTAVAAAPATGATLSAIWSIGAKTAFKEIAWRLAGNTTKFALKLGPKVAAGASGAAGPLAICSVAVTIGVTAAIQVSKQVAKNERFERFMEKDFDTVADLSQLSDEEVTNSIYTWLVMRMGI